MFCLIWQYILNRGPASVLTFFMASDFLFVLCIPLFYVILPFSCLLLIFIFCLLFLFLLIFLQWGIWREANSLVDPSLRRLVPNLLHLQLDSKAPSTVQKYRSGWLRWRQWAASKIGVQVIPAKALHVALFISELTVISVSNNTGISSIESVLYGIKWGHSLAGIVDCPTSHPIVKPSLEGARRKLAGPVQPKEPLSVDIVFRIADHYISSSSLAVIRFLFSWLASLAFSVWTKFVIFLLRMSLFAVNTSFFIPKRKNDQYREGHTSLLARCHKATCPVSSPFVRQIVKFQV